MKKRPYLQLQRITTWNFRRHCTEKKQKTLVEMMKLNSPCKHTRHHGCSAQRGKYVALNYYYSVVKCKPSNSIVPKW